MSGASCRSRGGFHFSGEGAGPSSAALRFVPLHSCCLRSCLPLSPYPGLLRGLSSPQAPCLLPGRSSHLPCLLLATVRCLVLSSVHTSLRLRLHATPLPLPAFPRSTLVVALQERKGRVCSVPFPSSILAVPACPHPATLVCFDAESAQGLSKSIQPRNVKNRDIYWRRYRKHCM